MEKFAVRLRELRTARNLTQSQLAEKLGLSESGIQNYERGIRVPKCDIVVAMADLFAVSVDYILGRSDSSRIFLSGSGPAHISEQALRLVADEKNSDIRAIYEGLSRVGDEQIEQLSALVRFLLEQKPSAQE